MEILETKIIHNAKKEHKCDLCSGKINKGDSYINITVVGDVIYAFKEHFKCSEIASYLKIDEYDEGISADEFREAIAEEYTNLFFGKQIKATKKMPLLTKH